MERKSQGEILDHSFRGEICCRFGRSPMLRSVYKYCHFQWNLDSHKVFNQELWQNIYFNSKFRMIQVLDFSQDESQLLHTSSLYITNEITADAACAWRQFTWDILALYLFSTVKVVHLFWNGTCLCALNLRKCKSRLSGSSSLMGSTSTGISTSIIFTTPSGIALHFPPDVSSKISFFVFLCFVCAPEYYRICNLYDNRCF